MAEHSTEPATVGSAPNAIDAVDEKKIGSVVADKETVDQINSSDDSSDIVAGKDPIIITGSDASKYLLPLRDSHEPALTFRSLVLATGLAAFQAVMYQIYMVSDRYPRGIRLAWL